MNDLEYIKNLIGSEKIVLINSEFSAEELERRFQAMKDSAVEEIKLRRIIWTSLDTK